MLLTAPATLLNGIGSQVQRPLATVLVGGMLIGLILRLLVVPAPRMVFIGKDDNAPPA
jgi:cobalt-zinc-cadmium resistance protein CzcA